MSFITVSSFWTKSRQVVYAQDASHVAMTTVWTVTTESPVIPGTVLYLGFRINVEEGTFFVMTSIESGVKVALRHL